MEQLKKVVFEHLILVDKFILHKGMEETRLKAELDSMHGLQVVQGVQGVEHSFLQSRSPISERHPPRVEDSDSHVTRQNRFQFIRERISECNSEQMSDKEFKNKNV